MLQLAICDDNQEDLIQIENILKSCLLSHHIQHNIAVYHSGNELLQTETEYRNGIDLGCELHKRNKLAPIIYILRMNNTANKRLIRHMPLPI